MSVPIICLFGRGRTTPSGRVSTATCGKKQVDRTYLNLVEDEDSIDLVTTLAQRTKPLLIRRHDTSFSLNRLHDDSACLISDKLVDAFCAIELRLYASRNERREGILVFLLMRD